MLTGEERQAIDNAIWTHYRIRLAESRRALYASRKKLLIFIPCLVLSVLLVLIANRLSNEVLVQYLYLPFWFFGYRVLTFPIFDDLPLLREMNFCNQLASMAISTEPEPGRPLSPEERETILRDFSSFRWEAHLSTLRSRMKEQLLMEDGIVSFGCTVRSAQELLHPAGGKGTELLSDELLDYLDQAQAFVEPSETIRLVADVPTVSPEEHEAIAAAIRNSYSLRVMQTQKEIRANLHTVFHFIVCLLLASLLLSVWGGQSGVAFHELILVLFSFFGDYLGELTLLTHLELTRQQKKWQTMSAMKVEFRTQEEA